MVNEIPATKAVEKPPECDTRERLLNAAEVLFAEHGVGGVSVREITKAAKTNLASMNYHFKTKKNLVGEVFERRLAPLNQRRIELLDALETTSKGRPCKVEAVLESLILPLIEQGNRYFTQLMGRSLSEPDPEVEKIICSCMEPMLGRYTAAFQKALPHLSEQETFARFLFIAGSLHHALLFSERPIMCTTACRLKQLRPADLTPWLVAFSAAGFRAPAAK
jgi:AcrR family transcriptional regulator